MSKSPPHRWDHYLRALPPILAMVAILIGVWKFAVEQSNRVELEHSLLARKSRIEFELRLWERRLDMYARLAEVSGRIAAQAEDPKALRKLVLEFHSLYWGALVLVDDEDVEEAVVAFHHEINDLQTGWSNASLIKMRAHRIGKMCERSQRNRWKTIDALGRGDWTKEKFSQNLEEQSP